MKGIIYTVGSIQNMLIIIRLLWLPHRKSDVIVHLYTAGKRGKRILFYYLLLGCQKSRITRKSMPQKSTKALNKDRFWQGKCLFVQCRGTEACTPDLDQCVACTEVPSWGQGLRVCYSPAQAPPPQLCVLWGSIIRRQHLFPWCSVALCTSEVQSLHLKSPIFYSSTWSPPCDSVFQWMDVSLPPDGWRGNANWCEEHWAQCLAPSWESPGRDYMRSLWSWSQILRFCDLSLKSETLDSDPSGHHLFIAVKIYNVNNWEKRILWTVFFSPFCKLYYKNKSFWSNSFIILVLLWKKSHKVILCTAPQYIFLSF